MDMFWVCPTGEVIDKEIVESGNGLKGSIEVMRNKLLC